MRGIASPAPRLKAMGRPKALGSRRSGRAGEPAAGEPAAGELVRASESLDDVPQDPPASLLPARWPDASPARSLWVITKDLWYYIIDMSVSPRKDRHSGAYLA